MVEMDSALPSGGFEWIAKAVSSDVGTLHHLSPHRLNELALNVIGGVADESICTNIRASYQSLLPKIIARIQVFNFNHKIRGKFSISRILLPFKKMKNKL